MNRMNLQNKRKIDKIIVHCSATEAGRNFGAADIDRWHKERGFTRIGYHYVVKINGTIEAGRDESVIGAHCKGYNATSIGVCYIGGLLGGRCADTRTEAQKRALRGLVTELRGRYPEARVVGHRELDKGKECPCFDVSAL